MHKRRWIKAAWPITISELSRRMRQAEYHEKSGSGFVIVRRRDDLISARFIEKTETRDTIISPLGQSFEINRTNYMQVEFVASCGPIGLEIAGPTSNLRPFVNSLNQMCGFCLSLSDIEVSPTVWGEHIGMLAGGDFYAESAQASDVQLGSGVIAKVAVNGAEDVSRSLMNFIGTRSHKVEKLKLRFPLQKTSVLLAANSSVSVSGKESLKFIGFAREALLDSLSARL